jgi:protocatechuate 3,4-dioxygenase, alpha subunit
MKLIATGNQPVGPFYHIILDRMQIPDVGGPGAGPEGITIRGRILNADHAPVPDGMIETWQANVHGKYAHPADTQDKPLQEGFVGFGRVVTDGNGAFSLTTVKPGRVPGPGGVMQAPHINVFVFMPGLLQRAVTRIYFPEEPTNAEDPVLRLVQDSRRATLVAKDVSGGGALLEWNVILGGEGETVFFDL